MKKEYNEVKCQGCEAVFKLRVSKSDYGQAVEVTCRLCGLVFKTVAYDKKQLNPLIEGLNDAINTAVSGDVGVALAVQSLLQAGFQTEVSFASSIVAMIQEKQKQVQSKVVLGTIRPGTFDKSDTGWMKELGVDFEKKDTRP